MISSDWRSQASEKKVWRTDFFAIFSSLLVPLEIAYNDSLQQCLTSNKNLTTSRGKTHEKKFGAPKLGPKLEFLSFS